MIKTLKIIINFWSIKVWISLKDFKYYVQSIFTRNPSLQTVIGQSVILVMSLNYN